MLIRMIPGMFNLTWRSLVIAIICLVVSYFGVKVLLWYLDKHW